MKGLITVIALLTTLLNYGQYKILSDSRLNPGVYKTFDQFINNEPDFVPNIEVQEHDIKHGAFNKYTHTGYGIGLPEAVTDEIGFIYGFSDGKEVYFSNGNGKIHSFMHTFAKLENLGQLCYMQGLWTPANGPRGVVSYLLDLEKSRVVIFNRSRMKGLLLSADQNLWQEFKKDKNQDGKYRRYFFRYLEIKKEATTITN